MHYFADVILPLPLSKAFTYILSEEEYKFLTPGFRVGVPFGKSKIYTGIIFKVHKVAPQTYEPKPIEVIFEEYPIVTQNQLTFWEWMSGYYLSTIGEVLRAALPSAFLLASETIITRSEEVEIEVDELSDEAFLILEALEKRDLKIEDIQGILDKKTVLPLIYELVELGYLKTLQSIQEKYKPKQVRYIRLNPEFLEEKKLQSLFKTLSSAQKQSECVLGIYQLTIEEPWIKTAKLKELVSANSGIIRTLLNKNIIEEQFVREDRILLKENHQIEKFELSNAQNAAFEGIKKHWKEKSVVLLEGVTSSGKTQVYFELIDEQLKERKQILFLLPEISLTAQMVQRLQKRFGNYVTVFHSKFSIHERAEVWKNILKGDSKAQIIIGARSSIFLPFNQLGLIIVDEEHETSFKQFDPAPRYQARDAAIVLARQHNCKVLLGSATPSVETRYNVERDKYGHVQLKERFGEAQLPEIQCVDLKEAHKKKEMKGMFSPNLFSAMESVLNAGRQVILFQNRRGYAPILECHSCGHIPHCTNCDVSLTYHQSNNQLRCHYCGYNIAKPQQCNACSSPLIEFKGTGTQQIEEQVENYFPNFPVERMDWDSTRGKYAFETIMERFSNQSVKILVGTQMVTKGLDFKHVGLVGVINADPMLYFPDFRSHERAYQMLTQVAGRAGRSAEKGTVIIQTFSPQHPILQQVRMGNYNELFNTQLKERKAFDYPPYFRLVRIVLRARDYHKVEKAAKWITDVLIQYLTHPVLGPVDPPVARVRTQYLKQILIKFPDDSKRNYSKKIIVKSLKSFDAIGQFRAVKVNVDVDPA